MIFYCDASLQLPVAKALSAVRDDILYPGHPACSVTSPEMPDEEWLGLAGDAGWVVLMRDKRIRSRPGERAKLISHGLRAFCLTTAGNATRWEVLSLMVQSWPAIERKAQEEAGPYICAVTRDGVRPLRL